MLTTGKGICSKPEFEPLISRFTSQGSNIEPPKTQKLTHWQMKPSSHLYFDSRLSECNTSIHNSKEINPENGYLVMFTLYVTRLV